MRDLEEQQKATLTHSGTEPEFVSQVTRHLMARAAQHPLTVTAGGAGALALIYLALLSPLFGGGLLALVVLLAGTGGAVINFIFRYVRDRSGVEQQVSDLNRVVSASSHEAAASRLAESLRNRFNELDLNEGTAVVEALSVEYAQVRSAMEQGYLDGMLAAAHIAGLADETYRRGLSVLCDAADLALAVRVPSRDEMQSRVVGLRRQVRQGEAGGSASDRLLIRKQELELAERRLEEIECTHGHIDELLLHARRCEAALAGTRLGLAAIKTGGTGARVDTVVKALQRTIQGAKEVQDELEKIGYSAIN